MSKHYFSLLFVLAAIASCTPKEAEIHTQSSTLPSLYITLPPDQLDLVYQDREYKAEAQALLITHNNDTVYDGNLEHIKTRGNSTIEHEKKPFAIKFPNKIPLLGLLKSQSFVLLANAFDESHIRNAIGLDLAKSFGIKAPRYAFLSLYINNKYMGLYQITNKIEIGKHTLRIQDLNKLNKQVNTRPLNDYMWFAYGRKKQAIQRKGVLLERNPDDITGGYLLDYTGHDEFYNKSVSGFVSNAGDRIQIRSPKYASQEQVNYISELYNQMEAAVLASDGYHPTNGRHYSEYIDVESFARYYLLNELLLNTDGGWGSFLMYKDTDSIDPKIYAGPAWDFDRTLNSPYGHRGLVQSMPNEIYVNRERRMGNYSDSGGLLYHLLQHNDFQDIVKSCYYKDISPACHDYLASGYLDSIIERLRIEADHDNQVYHYRYSANYDAAVKRAISFLHDRLEFFDWFFSTNESDRIKVAYNEFNIYGNEINAFFPVGQAIYAPQTEIKYNNDEIYALYYPGSDSIVEDGTVFSAPLKLELKKRKPSWREVQERRIQKKLKKWRIVQ